MIVQQEKLDEILIKSDYDVREAISAIKFYWNLARNKNEHIVVQIHKEPPKGDYCET